MTQTPIGSGTLAVASARAKSPETCAGSGEVQQHFSFPGLEVAVRAQLTSGPARMAIEDAGADVTAAAITGAYAGNRQPALLSFD